MKKIIVLTLILFLFIGSAFSGGYQVRLQGNRQSGMGLCGVSLFYDASNIFYNPSGLSLMKTKISFSVGASGIFNKTSFHLKNSVLTAETDNPMSTPFYVYGAAKITDKLAIGVGIYTPFGSTADWGEDWVGNQLIQKISLVAIFIQPTVSYKINDLISIGAGFVVSTGGVKLNKAVTYNSPTINGSVELDGSTVSYGYNLGIMITPIKKLSIGIDYRSKIMMSLIDGDATFTIPSSVTTIVPEKNKFDGELPLPANLDVGVSFQFTEKLLLSAEINYVFWGVYDTLKFEFKEKPELLNSSNPRKYTNTLIYRIGGEYQISDKFTFRAGAYYDPTPTNKDYFNPETVSLNTFAFTLGFTYKPIEKLSIDISYLQLITEQDERSYKPDYFTGTYRTSTIAPGIGINFNL